MSETITVPPAALEAIAHNVCSLHGFDPGFVRGQERFALAVITEYERTRTLPAARTGICRVCGCTENHACVDATGPCAWADRAQTLCTACVTRTAAPGHIHTAVMDAIHGDLMRQHPGGFTEEDGNSTITIPAKGGFLTLDVSALAETAQQVARPQVDPLRERCHHVVELLNGQEFAEDLKGEDVQALTLWAWGPIMVDQAQRERVTAFFAGREQAAIGEGDDEGGTDARARAEALIATLEGRG